MTSSRHRVVPARSGAFQLFESRNPVPGRDFPTSAEQMHARFEREGECRRFLEQVRWPGGFVCPACGSDEAPWRTGTGLLACTRCRQPAILTRGSAFHRAEMRLTRWFPAMWQLCEQELGMTPRELAGALELDEAAGQEELRTLHRAMAIALRPRLSGRIELGRSRVEVTCQQGGRRWRQQLLVAVAVALDETGAPRAARIRRLVESSRAEIISFACSVACDDAELCTTDWPGFSVLPALGYRRSLVAVDTEVQRLSSLLELWLGGHPEPVEADLLDGYLDELCFRFRYRSEPRGRMFYDLVLACLWLEPPAPAQAGRAARPA